MLAALIVLLFPATPAPEAARLHDWFAQADAILEANTPLDLSWAQARRRAEIRAELRAYADAGLFPHNAGAGWSPVFVDADDTRCAVAHLMEVTGEGALMRRIATETNRAYALELDDPEVLAWLDWHGLTAADAAAIQPSYPDEDEPPHCICGLEYGTRTFSSAVVVERAGDGLRVAKVYGLEPPWAVGDPIEPSWVHPARLDANGPWFLLVAEPSTNPERIQAWNIPLSRPCPAAVPYPGQAPAPLSHDDLAAVLLSPQNCFDALRTYDPRWTYTKGCDLCSSAPGDEAPGASWLLVVLLIATKGRWRR